MEDIDLFGLGIEEDDELAVRHFDLQHGLIDEHRRHYLNAWRARIGRLRSLPMSTAELPIQFDPARIAQFCRQRGIRRLAFFGSVLRVDFDPQRSDVDVLADFAPGALRGVGLRYFDYAPDLAAILGHRVDFCSQLHPVLRERVEQEALTVYEQA